MVMDPIAAMSQLSGQARVVEQIETSVASKGEREGAVDSEVVSGGLAGAARDNGANVTDVRLGCASLKSTAVLRSGEGVKLDEELCWR